MLQWGSGRGLVRGVFVLVRWGSGRGLEHSSSRLLGVTWQHGEVVMVRWGGGMLVLSWA